MFDTTQSLSLAASILQVAHSVAVMEVNRVSHAQDVRDACDALFPGVDCRPVITMLVFDWNGSIEWAEKVLNDTIQERDAASMLMWVTGRPVFVTDKEGNPIIAVLVP